MWVRSVVDLVFNVLAIVCGSSVFFFVLLCITLCPFSFCNHLEEEEKAGCFVIFVLQMYCYYNVLFLFIMVPWAGLQCVILVFPDHTPFLL